jgi:hypothetical protein
MRLSAGQFVDRRAATDGRDDIEDRRLEVRALSSSPTTVSCVASGRIRWTLSVDGVTRSFCIATQSAS